MNVQDLIQKAKLECKILYKNDKNEMPYYRTYAHKKKLREARLATMTEDEKEAWRQHRNAMQRKYSSTPEAKERLSVKNAIRYQERKARR